MRHVRTWLVAVTAVAGIGLAAAPTATACPTPRWIVNSAVVKRTFSTNPGLVQKYWNCPQTYEIGWFSAGTPSASRSVKFTNETSLENAISSHTLPAGTVAVVYDDERWTLTPTAQQLNPGLYYQRAAAAAHAAGLIFIATPATDLVYALAPGTPPSQQYNEFLALGVPGATAAHADIYEAQSQGAEASTASYASFVQGAASQARAANPNTTVLAGLSTNPNGHVQPSSVLLSAAGAVTTAVSGWWLDDPGPSTACPNCTGPYPQTVVDFLNGLSTIGY